MPLTVRAFVPLNFSRLRTTVVQPDYTGVGPSRGFHITGKRANPTIERKVRKKMLRRDEAQCNRPTERNISLRRINNPLIERGVSRARENGKPERKNKEGELRRSGTPARGYGPDMADSCPLPRNPETRRLRVSCGTVYRLVQKFFGVFFFFRFF